MTTNDPARLPLPALDQTAILRRYPAAPVPQPSAASSRRWCHGFHDNLARHRHLVTDTAGRRYTVDLCHSCHRDGAPALGRADRRWYVELDPLDPENWPAPPEAEQTRLDL